MSEQLRSSRSCSNQVFQANAFIHVTEEPRWGVWEQNQQFTVLYVALIFVMVIFVRNPPKNHKTMNTVIQPNSSMLKWWPFVRIKYMHVF